MQAQQRKEAIREFKERVTPQGIYAIRCAADGASWVGASRNLDAQRNGTWFQLNGGMHRNPSLQAAWKQYGADAFFLEVVETLPADVSKIALDDVLKERRSLWAQELSAIELG